MILCAKKYIIAHQLFKILTMYVTKSFSKGKTEALNYLKIANSSTVTLTISENYRL